MYGRIRQRKDIFLCLFCQSMTEDRRGIIINSDLIGIFLLLFEDYLRCIIRTILIADNQLIQGINTGFHTIRQEFGIILHTQQSRYANRAFFFQKGHIHIIVFTIILTFPAKRTSTSIIHLFFLLFLTTDLPDQASILFHKKKIPDKINTGFCLMFDFSILKNQTMYIVPDI